MKYLNWKITSKVAGSGEYEITLFNTAKWELDISFKSSNLHLHEDINEADPTKRDTYESDRDIFLAVQAEIEELEREKVAVKESRKSDVTARFIPLVRLGEDIRSMHRNGDLGFIFEDEDGNLIAVDRDNEEYLAL